MSGNGSQKDKSKASKFTCPVCKKTASPHPNSNHDGSAQCHVCKLYWHYSCIDDLRNGEREWIENGKKFNKTNYWTCRTCEGALEQIKTRVDEHDVKLQTLSRKNEELTEELEAQKLDNAKRDEDLSSLRKAINDLTVKVKNSATNSDTSQANTDNVIKEINLRKSKEVNLIINGQPEADENTSKEDCEALDSEFLADLFDYLKQDPPSSSISSARRLGPRKPEQIRPLQVIFKNKPARNKVLEAAPSLAKDNRWSKIRVGPDMTIAQRRNEQKLRQDSLSKNLSRTKDQVDKRKAWKVVGRKGQRRLLLVTIGEEETVDKNGQIIQIGTSQKRKHRDATGETPSPRREPRLSTASQLGLEELETEEELLV